MNVEQKNLCSTKARLKPINHSDINQLLASYACVQ